MLIIGSSGGNTGVPYIVIIIIHIQRVLNSLPLSPAPEGEPLNP